MVDFGLAADGAPNPVAVLEQGLSLGAGRPVTIVEARPDRFDAFSTHPISRLAVRLAHGPVLSVVFKRLQPGPEADVLRQREVRTYRRLLAGGRFGAPMLYAWLDDDALGHYWLFLEDVGDWVLDYCEGGAWDAALRWLARLHAAYQGREDDLAILGCLGDHGPAFYRNLARTARLSLLRAGRSRQLDRLDRLLDRSFDGLVADLAHQPRTLIHGDLSGHNVVVTADGAIRVIDWEWAAVGLPGWDLSRLLANADPARRGELVAIYLDELGRETARPPDPVQVWRMLARCDGLRPLWYLRWWTRRCQEPGHVDELLDRMETLWRRTEREGGDG